MHKFLHFVIDENRFTITQNAFQRLGDYAPQTPSGGSTLCTPTGDIAPDPLRPPP